MKLVALVDLAKKLKMHRNTVSRTARKLKVKVVEAKRKKSSAIVSAVSVKGAAAIQEAFSKKELIPQIASSEISTKALAADLGCAPNTVTKILKELKIKPVFRRTLNKQVALTVTKAQADLVRAKRPKLPVIS